MYRGSSLNVWNGQMEMWNDPYHSNVLAAPPTNKRCFYFEDTYCMEDGSFHCPYGQACRYLHSACNERARLPVTSQPVAVMILEDGSCIVTVDGCVFYKEDTGQRMDRAFLERRWPQYAKHWKPLFQCLDQRRALMDDQLDVAGREDSALEHEEIELLLDTMHPLPSFEAPCLVEF